MKRSRTAANLEIEVRGTNKRFQATRLFITYPQNPLDKNIIMDRFLNEFKDRIEWIIACNENHADDMGIHSHIALRFKKRSWVKHSILDRIGEKHGDYQTMKGREEDACKYIIKDGNYCTHGFKPSFEEWYEKKLAKKSPKENIIVDMLKSGDNLESLLESDHRGYVGFRLKKVKELQHMLISIEQSKVPVQYQLNDNQSEEMVTDSASDELYQDLINQLEGVRKHRQKHIYIYTETGVGKTVLLEQLRRRKRVFAMPSKHPLEGYEDGKYDLMAFEEFSPGGCKLSLLNNITGGGSTTCGETRYHATTKSDNILIIIVSNYAPQNLYPSMVGSKAYGALLTRFNFYQFTQDNPIRIWKDPEDNLQDLDVDAELPSWIVTEKPPAEEYYDDRNRRQY